MIRSAGWTALLICFAMPGLAQETCPWLNSATAGGILGGSVTSKVAHSGPQNTDGTCEFVQQSERDSVLRIEVRTMANIPEEFKVFLARCGSAATPVRGIGNVAVACRSKRNDQSCEQVIGRVRDRAFVVQLCAKETFDVVGREVREAADEISGNLF